MIFLTIHARIQIFSGGGLSDNYVWNYGKEVGCLRFIFSYFTTGIRGIRRIRSGPPTPSRFAQAVDIHSILLSFFSLLENDSILIYQLIMLLAVWTSNVIVFYQTYPTKVCLQIVYFTDQWLKFILDWMEHITPCALYVHWTSQLHMNWFWSINIAGFFCCCCCFEGFFSGGGGVNTSSAKNFKTLLVWCISNPNNQVLYGYNL